MSTRSEIGSRLRDFRLKQNLTQTLLAAAAGRSKQLVRAWEAGRAEITIDSVARIARTIGLVPRWLVLGESDTSQDLRRHARVGTSMPFRTIEQIIKPDEASGPVSDVIVVTYFEFPPGCFAMPCPDGSLEPRIGSRDLLIVDPEVAPLPGQLAAIVIHAEKEILLPQPSVVVRRIHYQSVRGLIGPISLVGEAPGWPTVVVRIGSDARLVGTIVGLESKLPSNRGHISHALETNFAPLKVAPIDRVAG